MAYGFRSVGEWHARRNRQARSLYKSMQTLLERITQSDPIETAIRRLWPRRIFWHGEQKIIVACLIRTADWRPLKADWWHGKEVSIIGADLDGNVFLRHGDGTIRYWDHRLQVDAVMAPSVRSFVERIVDEVNGV